MPSSLLCVSFAVFATLAEWEAEVVQRNVTGELWCSEVGVTVGEANMAGVGSVLENGMLRVDGVGGKKVVEEMRVKTDVIRPREEGKNANHHHNLAVIMEGEVRAVVEDVISNAYELLKGLVTEDGQLVELALMINDPGAKYQKWHADTVWEKKAAKLYSFFISLDEVTLDMGPTALVPRTHLESFITGCNDEITKTRKPICANSFDPLPKIAATLHPGDMMVMDSVLQHRANENSSTKRRRLIYFSLSGPGARPDGSTYTLHNGYKNLRLKDFRSWHSNHHHGSGIDYGEF